MPQNAHEYALLVPVISLHAARNRRRKVDVSADNAIEFRTMPFPDAPFPDAPFPWGAFPFVAWQIVCPHTWLMKLKDQFKVPIPCQGCGRKTPRSLADLERNRGFRCSCGATTEISGNDLTKMTRELDAFERKMKKLGR